MMTSYSDISIGGTDTAAPLNVAARLRMMEELVPLAGARVLDCGCGAGGYVRALRGRGIEAFGVEHSADKVAEYRSRGLEPERVEEGDLEALRFADGSFDVALLNEVLEHVPDEGRALREIHRVLVPGGRLIVFSPNRRYPFETHGVTWRGSGRRVRPARTLFVPYVPVALGQRVFDYPARNYWPAELRSMIEGAGFAIERTGYLWQTFENISGSQPGWMRSLTPLLRRVSALCERTPGVRTLGVSQIVVART
jgi:SAM-dependent methyltransferase